MANASKKQTNAFEHLEGRTFVLGREGHIYIDTTTVSKHHAEITVIDGRIYLRDLNSTNGTYLLKNKRLIQFNEGFVNPRQPIVIGRHAYIIEDLLSVLSDYYINDKDDETQSSLSGTWEKRVTHDLPTPTPIYKS